MESVKACFPHLRMHILNSLRQITLTICFILFALSVQCFSLFSELDVPIISCVFLMNDLFVDNIYEIVNKQISWIKRIHTYIALSILSLPALLSFLHPCYYALLLQVPFPDPCLHCVVLWHTDFNHDNLCVHVYPNIHWSMVD